MIMWNIMYKRIYMDLHLQLITISYDKFPLILCQFV